MRKCKFTPTVWLAGLLFTLALLAAGCTAVTAPTPGAATGAATAAPATPAATSAAGVGGMMGGMDHGAMMGQGAMMAGQTMMTGTAMMAGQPFDLLFIDGMIPHHQSAIKMAQEALSQAEHAEIKSLAQNIIDSQQKEIDEMQQWRTAWYTDTAPTMGMGMGMGMMDIPAGDQPFDLRFIDAMIPHHQGAVMMAQAALARAEHAELKTLAQNIIDAQQKEIAEMQQWRAAWYPDAK